MGVRFNRRVKIAPGISVNFGKRGASVSFGPRGSRVTVGPNRVTTSVGIPGTGLSYRKTYSTNTKKRSRKSYVSANSYNSYNSGLPSYSASPTKGKEKFDSFLVVFYAIPFLACAVLLLISLGWSWRTYVEATGDYLEFTLFKWIFYIVVGFFTCLFGYQMFHEINLWFVGDKGDTGTNKDATEISSATTIATRAETSEQTSEEKEEHSQSAISECVPTDEASKTALYGEHYMEITNEMVFAPHKQRLYMNGKPYMLRIQQIKVKDKGLNPDRPLCHDYDITVSFGGENPEDVTVHECTAPQILDMKFGLVNLFLVGTKLPLVYTDGKGSAASDSTAIPNATVYIPSTPDKAKPVDDSSEGIYFIDESKGIVTTMEEIEGYEIVKGILAAETDPSRIAYRDAKSYFAILFDDNNRKPICRLHFNKKDVKYISTFDNMKNETKHVLNSLYDINEYAPQLRAVVEHYVLTSQK